MVNFFNVLVVVIVLLMGIPIGKFLAYLTKDEKEGGQIWFKILICVSMVGAVLSLIFRQDIFLVTFLFIAIVTSQSLKR